MNQRTQLTYEQYAALPAAERQKAVREGRVDTVLGRTTPMRLAEYPADHQLTMDEYRAMPTDQRAAALRAGRMAHILRPDTTEETPNV